MACSVSDGLAAFSSVWDGSVAAAMSTLSDVSALSELGVGAGAGAGAGDEISICPALPAVASGAGRC